MPRQFFLKLMIADLVKNKIRGWLKSTPYNKKENMYIKKGFKLYPKENYCICRRIKKKQPSLKSFPSAIGRRLFYHCGDTEGTLIKADRCGLTFFYLKSTHSIIRSNCIRRIHQWCSACVQFQILFNKYTQKKFMHYDLWRITISNAVNILKIK